MEGAAVAQVCMDYGVICRDAHHFRPATTARISIFIFVDTVASRWLPGRH
jgi:hypothetical protein